MDLSNKKLALEEVKKRFPLGSTVVDKDGDRSTILDYKHVEIEKYDIWYRGDLHTTPDDADCIYLYRDPNKWADIESFKELPSSSPLQALFKNLINS